MQLVRKLLAKHNLGRARFFKREQDKAERSMNYLADNGFWESPEYSLALERFEHCEHEKNRYLRALGQEV